MKKIGILTFHKTLNYGAVLQAYALKTIIQSFNVSCDIINYTYPALNKNFRIFNKLHFRYKNVINNIFFVPKLKNLFRKFINDFLVDMKSIKKKDLIFLNDIYDIFITGSDQVWNGEVTEHDNSFLLDFVKDSNKINSYAASFGVTQLTDTDIKNYPKLLNRFKNISVREQQGIEIIKFLIGREDVVKTLDPTFLLTIDQWKKLINKETTRQDTVVMYLMGKNLDLISFAKKLAKDKNCKLIILRNTPRKYDKTIENIFVTPEQWLEYIYNAKYVVTNSFHGLAFSIIFNKTFFTGFVSTNNRNSRLENLLNLTNLRNRLIDNIENNYDKSIDWDSVNKIIDKERKKSLDYLKKIIN